MVSGFNGGIIRDSVACGEPERLPRNWHFGCGQCGAEVFVVDVGWDVRMPEGATPCVDCAAMIENPLAPNPMNRERPGVWMELGWCGCGAPEVADVAMLAYLEALARKDFDFPYGLDGSLAWLLAYLADDLGWTTHGGTVGGAWLEDRGYVVLQRLRSLDAAE